MNPAAKAPRIGATQNNQSWPNGSPWVNKACDKERAGFTEVLEIGMLIKCIKVKARPIAIPANFPLANLSVAPSITIKKNIVKRNSAMKTDIIE